MPVVVVVELFFLFRTQRIEETEDVHHLFPHQRHRDIKNRQRRRGVDDLVHWVLLDPLLRPDLVEAVRPGAPELRHTVVVVEREVLCAGGRRSLLPLGVVLLVALLPPGSLDADGRLGLPALATTMRGDPHRVTTQLEPDPSLSPQAPFASSSGTFTAPQHRTLT